MMYAGFGRTAITPPVGTRMEGFTDLQLDQRGAAAIHDELFMSALYCRDGEEEALILAYDVLFFSRETSDRLKAAAGRVLDMSPRQILINASHTHCGPHTSNYTTNESLPPDRIWLEVLERKTIDTACRAKSEQRRVTLHAAEGRCRLPVSRRRIIEGKTQWLPWPEATVCDALPVCMFRDEAGEPVCLLFSVSCHPSTGHINEFSAEFPGVARVALDARLGAEVSMFLQGAGGDAKPRVVADGPGDPYPTWRVGTWDDIRAAGEMVAEDVTRILDDLQRVEPCVQTAIGEMVLPLEALPGREQLEQYIDVDDPVRKHWAKKQLERLDRGFGLESSARILVQGICLATGVRLAALEGEAVAELGIEICRHSHGGVTFPLGCSNGMGLYLPVSRMLGEGGYEVESYFECGYAAPLAPGIETALAAALDELTGAGII